MLMRDRASFSECPLATRNALQDREPTPHLLVAVYVDQDRRRSAVLGDHHRSTVAPQASDDLGGMSLDLRDGFEDGHSDTIVSLSLPGKAVLSRLVVQRRLGDPQRARRRPLIAAEAADGLLDGVALDLVIGAALDSDGRLAAVLRGPEHEVVGVDGGPVEGRRALEHVAQLA